MHLSKAAQQELVDLARQSGGTLNPRAVIAWAAEHDDSALHKAFEWDDTKAAQDYRLIQARMFLRLVVTIAPQTTQIVRAFVSLEGDRGKNAAGYRGTGDALRDPDMRAQLIEQFLADMTRFEMRYRQIAELAKVFEALDEVRTSRRRPKDAGDAARSA